MAYRYGNVFYRTPNAESPEVSQLQLTVWRYGNRSAGLLIYCIANIAEQNRAEGR